MGEDLIYIVCDLSAHRRSSQPFSEIITAINLRALACSSGLSCLPTILQQYGFQAFALLRPIIQLFVDLRNSTCPTPHVVEQIIAYGRRIVQIMIQATDFAQILYRGHPSRKKTRATQNFNMAAIFQDGRHGLSWKCIFCLKWAADGWER